MNLNINDYKVLIGALQSLSIKGSEAIYFAELINKLVNHANELETKSQEGIDLNLPKVETKETNSKIKK